MTRRKGGRGPMLWTQGMHRRAMEALKSGTSMQDLADRFGGSVEWLRKKLRVQVQ